MQCHHYFTLGIEHAVTGEELGRTSSHSFSQRPDIIPWSHSLSERSGHLLSSAHGIRDAVLSSTDFATALSRQPNQIQSRLRTLILLSRSAGLVTSIGLACYCCLAISDFLPESPGDCDCLRASTTQLRAKTRTEATRETSRLYTGNSSLSIEGEAGAYAT